MRRYNFSVSSFLRRITIPILLLHPISTGMRTVVALRPSSSFLPKQPLRHDRSEPYPPASRSSMRTFTGEVFLHRRQSVQQPTSSVSSSVSLFSSSSNQGSSTGGVESLSLDILGENHELVGDEIATSVQAMLDTEWMPQTIHSKMGQSVKQSYIKVRQNRSSSSNDDDNDDDLIMTIMTTVADDLIANWKDYDKDAFVNAWDIANYVSDFLTTKVNGDGCGCSAKIY